MKQIEEAAGQEGIVADEFELGLLVGLLAGEGHFGGDGRQPQITLRMHVRHVGLFEWLTRTFPGGRLYGPYHHDGRHYYQWMARGGFLRDELVPLLDRHLQAEFDGHTRTRFDAMCARYARQLAGAAPRAERTNAQHRAVDAQVEGEQRPAAVEVGPPASDPEGVAGPGPEPAAGVEAQASAIFARLRNRAQEGGTAGDGSAGAPGAGPASGAR